MKLRLAAAFLLLSLSAFAQAPSRREVLSAMKKAAVFFSTRASINGGYVWNISEDFSRHYGEIPARRSQIWVQSGTPAVGMALLNAYDVTGDKFYLKAAHQAADALVRGQRPSGGWHYMIDFDPKGVKSWYRDDASKFKWGMEEQRSFNGSSTFDDGNSQGAARFLLRLYVTTKNQKYKGPLLKALNFILKAQYPNGAFPQRYPLSHGFLHDGVPDYTSYYTLNDGATVTAIAVLVEAYERLGDGKYLDAAKHAVDFLIAVQGQEGQAAWAEQYHPDTMKPVRARTHEPAGYVVRESEQVIETLQNFYKMTGDRRYLDPIPFCLDWFDRLNREASEFKRPVARYYEPGTNLPVYVLRTARTSADGYGLYDWTDIIPERNELGFSTTGSNSIVRGQVVDVGPMRREYERVKSLDAKSAQAEYERSKGWGELPKADAATVRQTLNTMDGRGAWVTDCRVLKLDAGKSGMNSGDFEMIRGYSTAVFIRNLGVMTAFIKEGRK